MNQKILYTLILAVTLLQVSCKREIELPSIGETIAEPIDIASSNDASHFYVLNADMDNSFETASILILDHEGNRVKAVEVPRLGRMLHTVGDQLFAIFSASGRDNDISASVKILDISTPSDAVLKNSWDIDCIPVSVTARENYDYFVVSCQFGEIYIGDLSKNTIHKVRDYRFARRAVHIDTKRNLVYAFPTHYRTVREFRATDSILADFNSYDEFFEPIEGANEIPDDFENDEKSTRRVASFIDRFKYVVYDISAAKEKGFPFEKSTPELQDKELRWLYFSFETDTLKLEDAANPSKYYRTNFWKAMPVPNEEDSFYLSHRGLVATSASPDANQIIKVTVSGDPIAFVEEKAPATDTFFQVEPVYSERINQGQEANGKANYLSDFEITTLEDRQVAIVNNFRDLSSFSETSGPRFSISAATLDDNDSNEAWANLLESTSSSDGFYQFALGQNNQIATISFYDNSVIFLEVTPSADIKEVKRIK